MPLFSVMGLFRKLNAALFNGVSLGTVNVHRDAQQPDSCCARHPCPAGGSDLPSPPNSACPDQQGHGPLERNSVLIAFTDTGNNSVKVCVT